MDLCGFWTGANGPKEVSNKAGSILLKTTYNFEILHCLISFLIAIMWFTISYSSQVHEYCAKDMIVSILLCDLLC